MHTLVILLAVALGVVTIHDAYQSRLLDKLADKYHISQVALKGVTRFLIEDDT